VHIIFNIIHCLTYLYLSLQHIFLHMKKGLH